MNLDTLTHLIAVPGSSNAIDFVHPDTGRTLINGHTLEQVREREPLAEVMAYADFIAAKAARQNTPVEWTPVSEERYHDMLNVLPPYEFTADGFLVGEAWDHDAATDRPRYAAFRRIGAQHFEANRPMTRQAFRELMKGGR